MTVVTVTPAVVAIHSTHAEIMAPKAKVRTPRSERSKVL